MLGGYRNNKHSGGQTLWQWDSAGTGSGEKAVTAVREQQQDAGSDAC